MLTEERYRIILRRLAQSGSVTVTELADQLSASESTIRRDLNALDALGKLTKVHGGATAITRDYSYIEHPNQEKAKLSIVEKEKIAQCAASTVCQDDFIFLDAGTTTQKMISHIPIQGVTVVTHALGHARDLAQRGIKVLLVGGQVKSATDAVIGSETVAALDRYNFTKCYLGVNGISLQRGFTTPDIDEANIKQTVMKNSQTCYVLADHSKFDQVSSVSYAPLSSACVITDHLFQQIYHEHCSIWEVEP